MIDQQDIDALPEVLDDLSGSFVTGSYLVDKSKANDIDVVVTKTAWLLHSCRSGVRLNGRDTMIVGNTCFDLQIVEDGEEYGDSDNEMFELYQHWRGEGINILIIRDMYLPAYRAAALRLESEPEKYTSRESRVDIHQRLKEDIRDMISVGFGDPC